MTNTYKYNDIHAIKANDENRIRSLHTIPNISAYIQQRTKKHIYRAYSKTTDHGACPLLDSLAAPPHSTRNLEKRTKKAFMKLILILHPTFYTIRAHGHCARPNTGSHPAADPTPSSTIETPSGAPTRPTTRGPASPKRQMKKKSPHNRHTSTGGFTVGFILTVPSVHGRGKGGLCGCMSLRTPPRCVWPVLQPWTK